MIWVTIAVAIFTGSSAFLSAHVAVHNLFNLGQHLIAAKHYRLFRQRAFASWEYAAAP